MKTMAELATENEKQAEQKQTLYYDRKASDRKLEVGQKVLILLTVVCNFICAKT
jgi:hypothetical protein